MMTNEYVLELCNVFHSGQVEPGTCFQKLVGNIRTGVILKDVSIEVHGGEVMAILGSKGSGKRALLEVLSRRAQGSVRGQILLNNTPVSLRLFQDNCGYVTHKSDLLPGLTVQQTLNYAANLTIGSKVSGFVKKSRVKQVLGDLALTQVANWSTEDITTSEYRRLVVAVQVVKDPVVLLLDEPTQDLDPLNTYFLVSILSNHAKKYNRIVVLTMEKPRSDIFPFLDRVTYLCLGDVVYTGSTRMMLDYFRNIGFPCPELENPLMYYLCLSTVDRRSRDRFVESTNQIAALVEKFKLEGAPFRKYAGPSLELDQAEVQQKMPLTAFGRPGCFHVLASLVSRSYSATFNFRKRGMKDMFLRLALLPLYFFILWIFYYGMKNYQRTFVSRNGLIFNCMAGAYFLAICITACTFGPFRTRYYQESREGVYSGPLFILNYMLFSFPMALLSMLAASRIVFGLSGIEGDIQWLMFACTLMACYLFAEQQTISIMMVVKSSFTSAACSIYFTIIYLVLASGTLKTLTGLSDWLYYLSYIVQARYTGAFLQEQHFRDRLQLLPYRNETQQRDFACSPTNSGFGCRYLNGTHYLEERYHLRDPAFDEDLKLYFNFGISFVFWAGMLVINLLLYVVPLPAFIKAKFRE